MAEPRETWQAKAEAKRQDLLGLIPPEWRLSPTELERAAGRRALAGEYMQSLLSEKTNAITALDSVELVHAMGRGSLSAVEVTRAFCEAAAVAHQIDPCLHEIFFDGAAGRAEELDAHLRRHGTTVGPLHGLPVSLKDQFHVKGVDTSMGYVGGIGGNLDVPEEKTHKVESQLVSELLSLGAVLYCKTACGQTLYMIETQNHIVGNVFSPFNRHCTSGGSSGGEGVLQGFRASSLGFGTDVGASLRLPAAHCGGYTLKPTSERLSYRDVANTSPGQVSYKSAVGPMATSVSGLLLAMRAVLSTAPWLRDPAVAPLPWREDVYASTLARADAATGAAAAAELGGAAMPLKLGILPGDGHIRPHPPVERAVDMVVAALKKAGGHKLVPWQGPDLLELRAVHGRIVTCDSGHDLHRHLDPIGEPLMPLIAPFFPKGKPPMPLLDVHKNVVHALKLEEAYGDYWRSTADDDDGQLVDAIIFPVAPHAAAIHGKSRSSTYTQPWNLLNYSVAVIPVTRADKAVDVQDAAYVAKGPLDKENWEGYDAEVYDNAPVGLQIICRKFEEEKVLAIAQIVETALKASYGSPSGIQSGTFL